MNEKMYYFELFVFFYSGIQCIIEKYNKSTKNSGANFHFVENDNSFDRQSIEKLAEFSVQRVTPRLLSISDDSASFLAQWRKDKQMQPV